MADAYSRITGKLGVCLTTSGPGATNLLTGIATAYLDSSPLLAITAQVERHWIGSDAFQEVDILGITLPVTKLNMAILSPTDIASGMKDGEIRTNQRPVFFPSTPARLSMSRIIASLYPGWCRAAPGWYRGITLMPSTVTTCP